MKRLLCLLLVLMMVLSGCSKKENDTTVPTESTAPPASAPVTEPTEPPLPPLLEQGEYRDNLLYLSNPYIINAEYPQMQLYENSLFLSEFNATEEGSGLTLKRISLEDGSLLAENEFFASGMADVIIGNGTVAVCDLAVGNILILDETLQLIQTYTLPKDGNSWHLDTECVNLYIFDGDSGISVLELSTNTLTPLLENVSNLTDLGRQGEYVLFQYTDLADLRTYTKCLRLFDGAIEPLPANIDVTAGVRSGNIWFLYDSIAPDTYQVISDSQIFRYQIPGSIVTLLTPKAHQLAYQPDENTLTLYQIDGTHVSTCRLPEEVRYNGSGFVWSGYHEGYFFTSLTEAGCQLLFWDPRIPTDGESLVAIEGDIPQPEDPTVDKAFYDRAEEISQRFGVDVRIAEECRLEYSHYYSFPLTDPYFLEIALNTLESALSKYPDGFFQQLCFDNITQITVEMVGIIVPREDSDRESPGAFAHNLNSEYLTVFDGYLISDTTIFHEISHMITSRIEWNAAVKDDALYQLSDWMALQPEGFDYAWSYSEMPESVLAYGNSGYFASDYGMTFPTEDMATLMELTMTEGTVIFPERPALKAKMAYYAACIRDSFDTTGWPSVTVWETALQ